MEIPSLETIPAAGSHLMPALSSWRAWKDPHSSAWAEGLSPCPCCAWCIPGVAEGLSRCLRHDALGHCVHGRGAGDREGKKSSLMSSQWKAGQEKWHWWREIRRDLLG